MDRTGLGDSKVKNLPRLFRKSIVMFSFRRSEVIDAARSGVGAGQPRKANIARSPYLLAFRRAGADVQPHGVRPESSNAPRIGFGISPTFRTDGDGDDRVTRACRNSTG